MPRKKIITSKEFSEMSTGLRLSTHEKVCAERMKTLFKAIDEMRIEVKQLRSDVSKGKGAINLLILLGGLAGIILGFLKWNG
jgi:hypothetical protein|tara:strand:- start:2028 stop:2273 length:246 start_codon:yes stop_codon:yes gene_type:complete